MITPAQISTPQSATATAVSSSFAGSVAAGDGVIVVIEYNGNTLTGVVDSDGNSLTLADGGNFFNAELAAIYFLDEVTTGGLGYSVTANFSSGTTARVIAFQVPGQITLDGHNHNSGNAQNPTAGSINTSNANTIVVLGMFKGGSIITAPAAFTEADNQATGDVCYNSYTSTQTGLNPQWTTNASTPFATAIAAFTSTVTTGPATGNLSDLLLFTDAFIGEPQDVLHWVDAFLTGTITPVDASWTDTFTWSDLMGDELNLKDTVTWEASEFVLIESYGPTFDTLTWDDTFGADLNLLGAGRYRR